MKFILLGSVIIITMSFVSTSFAQMSLEGISSGRYEVRKIKSRGPASEDPKEAVIKAEAKSIEVKTPEPTSSPAPIQQSQSEEKEIVEPTISEQAESLFSSKVEKVYDFYREQVHEDDVRNNRLELELLPVIAYNDSRSNYSFRDYNSYFNGLQIKANLWFTPLIGFSGKLLYSFAADVDSMAADHSRIPVKFEFVETGLNFRRFFGVSRKSSSVEFGVLYSENKMTAPSNNLYRARLKSQGLGIALKTRVPSSSNYSWVFGGSFFPRLQHVEDQPGVDLRSGSSEENIRVGIEMGGEWKFTREGQMVWGLSMSAERNMFTGQTSLADPKTSLNPSNVSVTSSMYLFSLGYRWGH